MAFASRTISRPLRQICLISETLATLLHFKFKDRCTDGPSVNSGNKWESAGGKEHRYGNTIGRARFNEKRHSRNLCQLCAYYVRLWMGVSDEINGKDCLQNAAQPRSNKRIEEARRCLSFCFNCWVRRALKITIPIYFHC